jgi:DNA-binding transcriptional ArsR family regulator
VIRLTLTESDIGAAHLSVSPLWETTGALLLLRNRQGWPYDGWSEQACEALEHVDRAALAPLLGSRIVILDSLLPAPVASDPSIEDELETMARFSARTLRHELAAELRGAPASELAPFFDRPAHAVAAYVEALHDFWQAAVAPQWPAMRSLLEQEIIRRAREVATTGSEAMFRSIHPRLGWKRPVLELDKQYEFELQIGGRGLAFVPLVFSRALWLVSLGASGSASFAISFPARGVGTIWGDRSVRDRRLEALVGIGRAAVIRELVQLRTTAELAARLHVAPSTASHHLSVLRRAQLVTRRRFRRDVYYALNEEGLAVATAFGISPPDADDCPNADSTAIELLERRPRRQ